MTDVPPYLCEHNSSCCHETCAQFAESQKVKAAKSWLNLKSRDSSRDCVTLFTQTALESPAGPARRPPCRSGTGTAPRCCCRGARRSRRTRWRRADPPPACAWRWWPWTPSRTGGQRSGPRALLPGAEGSGGCRRRTPRPRTAQRGAAVPVCLERT